MCLHRWRFCLLLAALAQPLWASAEVVVHYPRPEAEPDVRSQYAQRLLELVLQRAYTTYRLELHPIRMQQGRAIVRLMNDQGIEVLSTVTSVEREQELLPIRIPIDKGLIGWRLLLINREQAPKFASITSLASLKQLTAGQGSDWPDVAIMRANGLSVYDGTSNYVSLFSMLERERIDYFPRAVTEIWSEAEQYRQRLMVEPSVVLRYPSAMYFFVRKGNVQLATDIREGLEKMIADGSFEKLFQERFGATIARSGLKERRILDLSNPLKPSRMPLDRKNLWYRQ
jgi:hypothetical protein